MRAFLSHSSLDKEFVQDVAARLGPGRVEYDATTFEKAIFNTQAIVEALARSDIFVLFASERSAKSTFVQLETRLAYERLGSGNLSKIVIICIDDHSIDAVPLFLRELNIVTTQTSPGAAARRINGLLIDAEAMSPAKHEVFVGRDELLGKVKDALTRAPDECPTAIAISGQPGSGRRTLAKKALKEALPTFASAVEISIASNSSIDDFYIALIRSRGRRTSNEAIDQIRTFLTLEQEIKIQFALTEIDNLLSDNETVFLYDDGGLNTDGGKLQGFLDQIITSYEKPGRPVFVIIRKYLPPFGVRRAQSHIEYFSVEALSSRESEVLMGAYLKLIPASYTTPQIQRLGKLSAGLPINASVIGSFVKELNSDVSLFLADSRDYVAWRASRAQDYVAQYTFDKISQQLIGALLSFHYLPTELILAVFDGDDEEIAASIRLLQDRHCTIFSGGAHTISPALVDAFERADHFRLPKSTEREFAERILSVISEYKDTDNFSVSLIEPAIIATLKHPDSKNSPVKDLVLPSHLVMLARDSYNNSRFTTCIDYCDEALNYRHRMSQDALIEALRLKGMSAARQGKSDVLDAVLGELNRAGTRTARKHSLFLKGFSARMRGEWTTAEQSYLRCFDLDSRNFSVCRELGQVYLSMDRHSEAETYARRAHEIAPTNPFVLDIMVGILIGISRSAEEIRGNRELDGLLSELKTYGSGSGQSFFSKRMAERSMRLGQIPEAKQWISTAIKETPWLPYNYYLQAKIALRDRDFPTARRAVQQISKAIEAPQNEDGRSWLVFLRRIEFEIAVSAREYRVAHNLLENAMAGVPSNIKQQLSNDLAGSISFDERFKDRELIEWAKTHRDTFLVR